MMISPSRYPISMESWAILRSALHAHASDESREWSVRGLVHLIRSHGWRQIPPLDDDDILAVWPIVVHRIKQCSESSSLAHDIRGLVAVCWKHASATTRLWMWKTMQERTKEVYAAAVALHWGMPLWTLPNGITILTAAICRDPQIVDGPLRTAVEHWCDAPDPTMTTTLRVLTTEVLIPAMLRSVRPPTVAVVRVLGAILCSHPDLFFDIPMVAQTIFAACADPGPEIAAIALDILATIRPLFHPAFQPTMETVVRQTTDAHIRHRAANLLLMAFRDHPRPSALRQLIATAVHQIGNPAERMPIRMGAAAIVRAAMQWEETVPEVLPYLRTIVTNPDIPLPILTTLGWSVYHPACTTDMITLANRIIPFYHWSLVTHIFRRAWGNGCDDLVYTVAATTLHSGPRVWALQDGLYSPTHGGQVATCIIKEYPDQANECIIDGIHETYRPHRPIPPDVVPLVVQALHDPLIIARDVNRIDHALRALADTDPHAALTVIHGLAVRGDPQARLLAIRLAGYTWGQGYDRVVADLIRLLMHDPVVPVIRPLTEALLNGIERIATHAVSTEVLTDVFHAMVDRVPWEGFLDIVRTIVARRESVWTGGEPPVIVKYLTTLWSRCLSGGDATIRYSVVRLILTGLRYGWGMTHPAHIFSLLDRIMDSIRSQTQIHRRTHTVIRAIACVLRAGWGHGADKAIAHRFHNIMVWLDTHIPDWEQTTIGTTMLLAIIAGGGNPEHCPPDQNTKGIRFAIRHARMEIGRLVSHDPSGR